MPTTSMKRSKVEQEGGTLLNEGVDSSRDDYHYGLRISLEDPEMQKLNLEDPKVDGTVTMKAIGKIVSYTKDENGRSAVIQITDLGFLGTAEDRQEVMYPGDK